VRRAAAITALVALVLVVVAELAAVPLATAAVQRALDRCLPVEQVTITSVDRPVVPRLLLGRVRGAVVEAEGLELDALRVDAARIEVPLIVLPWALDDPPLDEATLELALTQTDLQAFLEDTSRFGLVPVLELAPGTASLGLDAFPARVRLAVEVADGTLRLAPVAPVPTWFEALDLELAFELPADLRLDELRIGDGTVAVAMRVDVIAGIDGSPGCAGPLGDLTVRGPTTTAAPTRERP
jgi:hypothetical protein